MLADHQRMAAYHSAILGNQDVFRDKVVMDIGTGSGILAVWAAQAGARKVYAIEYTDMAKHARKVMEANGVSDVVEVIQGAVEEIELPMEADNLQPEPGDNEAGSTRVVDIIISEWMGYFRKCGNDADHVHSGESVLNASRTSQLTSCPVSLV